MARSSKTPKFVAFNSYPNGFGPKQDDGRVIWDYLDNSRPLILEIGCGKAELGLELARRNPDKNVIGIDLKADRLYVPASTALEEGLTNIAFIQADTKQLIDVFKEGSVDEIWLTFPDPYPKDRQAKHRMTGQNFVKLYHKLLKPGGIFHFKTDDRQLFAWSLGELATDRLLELNFQTDSLHDEAGHDEAKILTFYEKRFLAEGLKTNYLRATKAK